MTKYVRIKTTVTLEQLVPLSNWMDGDDPREPTEDEVREYESAKRVPDKLEGFVEGLSYGSTELTEVQTDGVPKVTFSQDITFEDVE